MVKKYECDKPMAEKKGFLPCDKNCKACHACIKVGSDGLREHVSRIKDSEEGKKGK